MMRFEEFTSRRATLIEYLRVKCDQADWHGVSDAANDLRVLEAEWGVGPQYSRDAEVAPANVMPLAKERGEAIKGVEDTCLLPCACDTWFCAEVMGGATSEQLSSRCRKRPQSAPQSGSAA